MNKIIRTLILSDEVSLVVIDATEMINDAIEIHGLSAPAAVVFGKSLMAMTYMSDWLKDPTGEISANIKGNGAIGTVCISGDYSLSVRGSIQNPDLHCPENEVIGQEGYMTVVRDDAYAQPFVGTVPIHDGRPEVIFGEYYFVSEQLPTFIFEDVAIDENKKCKRAFAAFLQPMPGASAESKTKASEIIRNFAAPDTEKEDAEDWVRRSFDCSEVIVRHPKYKCKCSRRKISGLLLSMKKDELDEIIRKEGAIKVHCHYCNTDYNFTREDVDELFSADGSV